MPHQQSLFDDLPEAAGVVVPLAEGAALLRGFALPYVATLKEAINKIIDAAPLRCMQTPGGRSMSVAMTNCEVIFGTGTE